MQHQRFVQGERDAELFALLGPHVTDSAVHRQLGMPVTSLPGDVWHVARRGKIVQGFANTRVAKTTGRVHLRFLWAPEPAVQEALLQAVLADEAVRDQAEVYTNDRETATLWARHGFTSRPIRKGWCFVRWGKPLKGATE